MKTLAVGVLLALVGSPLAGAVVMFSRIPTADLAAGFKALAFAGAISLVVSASCWGAARIVEAWQPKAPLNIDARKQKMWLDNRSINANLDAPQDIEQMTPMQAYLWGQEVRR